MREAAVHGRTLAFEREVAPPLGQSPAMSVSRPLHLLCVALLCGGCGGPVEVDAGFPGDAGTGGADAGASDAGVSVDAGADVDAGDVDGGTASGDAGSSSDAGAGSDAGVQLDAGVQVEAIKALAVGSACYRYQWPGRGQMPRGYAKGVALSFARGVCAPSRADVAIVAMAKTTNTQRDALAWYSAEFAALNLDNSVAGLDTFRHAYTLLVGLGMRESSGEHCVGRDQSATNTTADSAEAGAWQTSYDSRGASPVLPALFSQYRASTRGCFSSTYAEGVTCSAADWQNWGTGDGAVFQQLEKECPGFAAEYAAVMLRVQGGSLGHYGPLRTKAAEIRPECDAMLRGVQAIVQAHPEVCSVL